uniref:Photosystem II reaction center protein Z n=1 Tax=Chamaegastrodia shikokiana TaxID=1127247 RepID=A0A6G7KW91_9ASPA|nr:photosystem II subunit Z [Chamaegastrodia shikokiana]QII89609.1 photosystem II subunit Z [Chamaegastrodia shikokiana]
MTIAFQLAIFALIATSLILLIRVPVVFASSDDWSKMLYFLVHHYELD